MEFASRFLKWITVGLLGLSVMLLVGCGPSVPATPSGPPVSLPAPKPAAPSTTTPPASPGKQSALPGRTAPTGDVTIKLEIPNQTVKQGDSLAVNAVISTKIPLRGASCRISFDPKVLKCEKVEEGAFFKSWAATQKDVATGKGLTTLVYPAGKIDNRAGLVEDFGVAVMGYLQQGGGVTGSGVFCTYLFTAVDSGTVTVRITGAEAADQNGKTVSVQIVDN